MSEYALTQVSLSDKRMLAQVDALLVENGITRDANLDYICAMVDGENRVIATGSCFGATLRCFAVSQQHQGEGLLNEVVSHLMEYQMARGYTHLFLYTKIKSAKFFQSLGFYEIARVDGTLVFMENRRNGFPSYLSRLEKIARPGVSGAIVMNANPFTLGHQYLVETAAARCDTLHLFLLSEDASLVPFGVRKQLGSGGNSPPEKCGAPRFRALYHQQCHLSELFSKGRCCGDSRPCQAGPGDFRENCPGAGSYRSLCGGGAYQPGDGAVQ